MKRKMVKYESKQVPAWEVAKSGDSVEGKYVERKSEIGKYKSNIYVIEQENKEEIGVWGNKMIDDFFMHLPLNTWVQLVYLGEKEGKNGQSYKTFDMFHEELKDGYVRNAEPPKNKEEKEEVKEDDVPF